MKNFSLFPFFVSIWFGFFTPSSSPSKIFASFFSVSFSEKIIDETTQKLTQNLRNLEKGEKLFINNCTACHLGRNNVIIPEKDLKIETLEANGMNSIEAITYQIRNGKNGMPAFGGRLTETEITQIAEYLCNF
jgi:cytochrome c6